jgi:hypothetical protein
METYFDNYESNMERIFIKSIILNDTNFDSMFKKKINNDCYFIVFNNRIDIYRLILDNYNVDELVEINNTINKINSISYMKLRNIYIKQNIKYMFPFGNNSCEMKIMERNLFKFLGNNINDLPINSMKPLQKTVCDRLPIDDVQTISMQEK